jgi:hypothetical protein
MSVPSGYKSQFIPTNIKYKLNSLGLEIQDGPALNASATAAGGKDNKAKQKGSSQQQAAERKIIIIENGGLDSSDGSYGDLSLVQSAYEDKRPWLELAQLKPNTTGWLRGRVHNTRDKGKFAFVVLRRGVYSAQVILEDGVNGFSRDACKWSAQLMTHNLIYCRESMDSLLTVCSLLTTSTETVLVL